ncbi:hypothetical protein [Marinobacter sp. 2_MG-2023]|uniref:hypothetical protein n=1 Tax=Marinobacter sp. 2_MG-2023 TaxID=3062679 RepID=UPI0026E391BC|nr:hypothetical protein [Marinobacter sp. 2_MG-2023]MDO6442060.1 hypothetical protein [Marinobacter sp. 2_MG-2023]
MTENLLGLGDNDIADYDRRKREELRQRNPENRAEVTLEMWTLAILLRDDQVVKKVVYGVVTDCLTGDYTIGEVACSQSLINVPQHPGRRIFVSQKLRYECKGPGTTVTIPEHELNTHLPYPDDDIEAIKRRVESGKL